MSGRELDALAPEHLRTLSLQELRELAEALSERNRQLQQALDSRVVIEQAKGILAGRLDVGPSEAFELLRSAARSSQRRLGDLAGELVATRELPPALTRHQQSRTLSTA